MQNINTFTDVLHPIRSIIVSKVSSFYQFRKQVIVPRRRVERGWGCRDARVACPTLFLKLHCARDVLPDICFYVILQGNQNFFGSGTPRILLGTLIPVFKKDSRTNKNNYRPSSILPNVSKIFLCMQISLCMHTNINANICINKSLRILRKGFLVNINLDLEEVAHSFQYGNQGSEFDLGSRYLQYFQI